MSWELFSYIVFDIWICHHPSIKSIYEAKVSIYLFIFTLVSNDSRSISPGSRNCHIWQWLTSNSKLPTISWTGLPSSFEFFFNGWITSLEMFAFYFSWMVGFSFLGGQFLCYSQSINPSRPNPGRREKITLSFYFHTSLWCLKSFYEGFMNAWCH